MIKRTCVLFISLTLLLTHSSADNADTSKVSKGLIIGVELSGPVIFNFDENKLNLEGYMAYRLNDKYYAVIEPGYSSYKYSQYNYEYRSEGFFLRIGTDINLIKPKNGTGKHFAGFGFRYGISLSTHETPWLVYENYWGRIESFLEPEFFHSHFLEAGGGVKAEIFNNIFIGWSVKVRFMLYSSAPQHNQPAYIPGVGAAGTTLRPAFSYWLAWQLPFKFTGTGK